MKVYNDTLDTVNAVRTYMLGLVLDAAVKAQDFNSVTQMFVYGSHTQEYFEIAVNKVLKYLRGKSVLDASYSDTQIWYCEKAREVFGWPDNRYATKERPIVAFHYGGRMNVDDEVTYEEG